MRTDTTLLFVWMRMHRLFGLPGSRRGIKLGLAHLLLAFAFVWQPAFSVFAQQSDLDAAIEWKRQGDYQRSLPVLKRFAAEGNPVAQFSLAEFYYKGIGVPQDLTKAAELYETAAQANILFAQQNIAIMYLEGKGVKRDLKRAVEWFQKAATQGDPFAQFSLGLRYANGEGVNQDYGEAMKWFSRAADQHFVRAFYQIGMLYAEGKGVQQNFQEAVAWTRQAAEAGYPPAQFNLGVAYQEGQGVPRDTVEAYKWFSLSAVSANDDNDGSFESSEKARSRVRQQISAAQVKRGDAAVQEWLRTHPGVSPTTEQLSTGGKRAQQQSSAKEANPTTGTFVLSRRWFRLRGDKEGVFRSYAALVVEGAGAVDLPNIFIMHCIDRNQYLTMHFPPTYRFAGFESSTWIPQTKIFMRTAQSTFSFDAELNDNEFHVDTDGDILNNLKRIWLSGSVEIKFAASSEALRLAFGDEKIDELHRTAIGKAKPIVGEYSIANVVTRCISKMLESSTGRYWVIWGEVRCPSCDPSKGETSSYVAVRKSRGGVRTEQECKKAKSDIERSYARQKLDADLLCLRVEDQNALSGSHQ